MVPLQILFAHPEILIENKKVFNNVLKSKICKERIKAIVVDEVHLVVEWWVNQHSYWQQDCNMFRQLFS